MVSGNQLVEHLPSNQRIDGWVQVAVETKAKEKWVVYLKTRGLRIMRRLTWLLTLDAAGVFEPYETLAINPKTIPVLAGLGLLTNGDYLKEWRELSDRLEVPFNEIFTWEITKLLKEYAEKTGNKI